MFLNLIFTLVVLMIVRIIWLIIKEKPEKEVEDYFKNPLTMSIGERLKRKHRHLKW